MKRTVLIILATLVLMSFSITALAITNADYEKALKYYNAGKYSEAVKLLKEYVKKNPNPSAYYRIGYGLYKQKNFDEANEYFKEAYLIDPSFSLGLTGVPKKYPKAEMAPKPTGVKESTKQTPSLPVDKKKDQVTTETKPVENTQQKSPVAVPQEKPAAPEPPKVETPEQVQTPEAMPPLPGPQEIGPGQMQGPLAALIAGFMMFFVIIGIVLYVYYSLCLFRIAKKLNIEAAWIAWVPLIQIWIIVVSAGKPGWWVLLLFVPIVNLFVSIYLWICITENLGKNKWLGLLMLVPLVNLIFLGILAFSKTESANEIPTDIAPA